MSSHFVIEIEPTTACTRNCAFCRPTLLPIDLNDPAFLSEEDYSKLLDGMAECGWDKWVVFCGHGEPTMHPDLVRYVAMLRRAVPKARVALATNGDLLTPEFLRETAFDSICWDVYEHDETSRRVGGIVKKSGFHPAKFAVIDCTAWPSGVWLSRAGTSFKSPRALQVRRKPCGAPRQKIFYSARGAFCLCCNDGHRRISWNCSLKDLLANPEYVKAQQDLALGNRAPYAPCCDCEYTGTPPEWPENGLSHFCPSIDKTRFWAM